MTKHTHYTEDFKRQAVELLETRNTTATQLARELGVRQNQLYKWREEIKKKGSDVIRALQQVMTATPPPWLAKILGVDVEQRLKKLQWHGRTLNQNGRASGNQHCRRFIITL